MDFSIRYKFAGVTFKPTKNGTVRWATVQKMLGGGKVECVKYNLQVPETSVSPVQTVIDQANMRDPDRCCLSRNGPNPGNPRYAHKLFIQVSFHYNSFVTLFDLGDLPELADGTEVDGTEVDEACQACVGGDCEENPGENPGDPPALVTKGCLRLVVDNT